MKDPTRLVDLSSDPHVVTLLRAGAAEQPTDGSLRRTLRAAAVGGSIAATSWAAAAGTAQSAATSASLSGSSVAAGSAASTGLGVGGSLAANAKAGVLVHAANASLAAKVGSTVGLIKWVGVGVVGAASVTYAPEAAEWVRTTEFGGSHTVQVPVQVPPTAAPRAIDRARAAAAVPVAVAAESELKDVPASPGVAAARNLAFTSLNNSAQGTTAPAAIPGPSNSPARSTDNFTKEVQLVETSRNALRAGDPARSLSLLTHYEAQYPRLQLRPEVLRLRLEALEQLGRSDAARSVAREILQLGATGAHAERARTLLDQ